MWQRKVAHSTEDEYNTFSELAKHIRDHHPELLNGKPNYVLSPEGAARMDEKHTPEHIQHLIRTYTMKSHPEAYDPEAYGGRPLVTHISNEICGCGNPAYATGTDGQPICKEHLFKEPGDPDWLGGREKADSEAYGDRWLYNQNPPVLDSARQEIDNIPSFTNKEWKNMGVTFNGKPHTGSRINWQQRYAMDEGEFGKAMNPDQRIMTIPCRTCGVDQHISVNPEQQRQLQLPRGQRPHIQDILPHHPVGVRELFISGTCDPCWKKMFR